MAKRGATLEMNIISEIKESFSEGSITIKLIYINLVIFVLVCLSDFVSRTWGLPSVLSYLWMPTSFERLLFRPWTTFTYMFVHHDFIHIFFNMMCLYWFGRMTEQFLGEHIVMRVYIIGGLVGALTCLFWDSLIPLYGNMLGASAAILALMTLVATMYPNYVVNVVFVGQVRLKYYALFFVVIYMLFILGGASNVGGNVAHLGGMAAGYILAKWWQKNGVPKFSKSLFKRNTNSSRFATMHVSHGRPLSDMDYNRQRTERSREVDRILDKIKATGYDSLTAEERQTLFDESKR